MQRHLKEQIAAQKAALEAEAEQAAIDNEVIDQLVERTKRGENVDRSAAEALGMEFRPAVMLRRPRTPPPRIQEPPEHMRQGLMGPTQEPAGYVAKQGGDGAPLRPSVGQEGRHGTRRRRHQQTKGGKQLRIPN